MPSLPAFSEETAKLVHFRQLVEHASPSQAEPLPVSFVPPNAYWTSVEKATFFQSLARHSRWRPDLISEDIGGGKSVADVCSYIELLEQGSQEAQNTYRSRDTLPMAREVSDDWMRAEESIADILHGEEARWQKATLKRKRAEAVKSEKMALQPDCERGSQDRRVESNDKSIDHGSDLEETWYERFKKQKKILAKVWKREDLLSALNEKYLKAMESMVRTLEQGETEREMVNSMEAHLSPLPHTLSQTVPSPPFSSDTSVGPHPDAPKSSSINDSQMGPSVASLEIQSLSHTMQLPTNDTNPRPSGSRACPQSPSSPAGAPDALLDGTRTSVPVKLPRDLSPDSRRRIRKRLWMRRKRALSNGLPLEEVPTDVRKLKPGRKGKIQDKQSKAKLEAQTTGPASSEPKPDTPREEDQCKDTDDLESSKRKNIPGWTKLERVAADGSFLRNVGLDLFKLGNFAGLISLMNGVHRTSQHHHGGMEKGLEAAGPRISYSYLLLFRAHLTHFLSRVIAQILVQRQVEVQQKRRIGRRSHSNRTLKIKPKNVNEALSIMGHPSTHKQFFRRLKILVREAAVAGNDEVLLAKPDGLVSSNDSDSSTLSDTSSTRSDSDMDGYTDVSNGRGDGYDSHGPGPFPDSFIPQSEFQLVWNPIGGQVDETLLPENTDEEELLKEFEAEEVVDSKDQAADREFEDSLWEEMSGQRQGLITPVDISGDRRVSAKSLRFREPGGAVKSRVYIHDSDEDEWQGADH